MTTAEFSHEFDIAYNSIASNSAPGIDVYEKSVYLTRAQLEIVNNYFNPKGNKYQTGFEQSSKRRVDLRELVKGEVSVTAAAGNSDDRISEELSQMYRIKNDVFLIIQEKAKVSSTDACINDTYIKVKPITHDEYNTQENNPFKKPDQSVIWRLDYSTISFGGQEAADDVRVVELLSPYTVTQYKYRYVKYPEPIILANLSSEYPNESLTIDGVFIAQTCKLNESIHREILNRAVEMAVADYAPEKLKQKVELNQRNE